VYTYLIVHIGSDCLCLRNVRFTILGNVTYSAAAVTNNRVRDIRFIRTIPSAMRRGSAVTATWSHFVPQCTIEQCQLPQLLLPQVILVFRNFNTLHENSFNLYREETELSKPKKSPNLDTLKTKMSEQNSVTNFIFFFFFFHFNLFLPVWLVLPYPFHGSFDGFWTLASNVSVKWFVFTGERVTIDPTDLAFLDGAFAPNDNLRITLKNLDETSIGQNRKPLEPSLTSFSKDFSVFPRGPMSNPTKLISG
jgi:hypothetical protein